MNLSSLLLILLVTINLINCNLIGSKPLIGTDAKLIQHDYDSDEDVNIESPSDDCVNQVNSCLNKMNSKDGRPTCCFILEAIKCAKEMKDCPLSLPGCLNLSLTLESAECQKLINYQSINYSQVRVTKVELG